MHVAQMAIQLPFLFLFASTREITTLKCAKNGKSVRVSALLGRYSGNHGPDGHRTNTSLVRVEHAGEWNTVLAGTCNANGTSETN